MPPLLGSNHFGIAGYYAMQALKENMIVSETLQHQFELNFFPLRGKLKAI